MNALSEKSVEDVLRTRWSGKNYSERVWANTEKLGKKLEQVMADALHRGADVKKMAQEVAPYLRQGYGLKSAERLIQTELNYVQNQAALASIRDAGFKYFRFIAVLDARTTLICREHDGGIFSVDDGVGQHMPPLHVRCRSTIAASFGEGMGNQKGTRMARDMGTGKSVHVPAAMTYEDFYSTFIQKKKSITTWKLEQKFGTIASGNLEEAIGTDHYKAVQEIVEKCPDTNVKMLWKMCEPFIEIEKIDVMPAGRAWCNTKTRKISFNLMRVVSGDDCHFPYQNLFHEPAHAIDMLYAKIKTNFSPEYKNGAFEKAIRKDADAFIGNMVNEGKKLFADAVKKNDAKLLNMLFGDVYQFEVESDGYYTLYEYGKHTGGGKLSLLKWNDAMSRAYVKNTIKSTVDERIRGDVSDILEGATNGKICCGVGHGQKYWLYAEHLPCEAFAEFFDATMINADALDFMRRTFPSAYKVFQDMIKEMLKW